MRPIILACGAAALLLLGYQLLAAILCGGALFALLFMSEAA